MRTLTIKIETDTMAALEQAGQRFVKSWDSGCYSGEFMSFESPISLFRLLTPARWGVLEKLQRVGPCGLRPLARLLGRDASAVHRDVSTLLEYGLIEKNADEQIFVPFSRIHAEFDLAKAA
jgi:predicted transcriptional regulator